ncbi:MAG: hypothetical protein V8S72_04405 [Oscillospiraceae bacterium]
MKYFSQDGVNKLAPRAGIELDELLSPAEKLKDVQKLMEAGDGGAAAVYRSIGVYLAHTLAYYRALYGCGSVLLLGRVMSGKGGELITSACEDVLRSESPLRQAAARTAGRILPSGRPVRRGSLPARNKVTVYFLF